MPQDRPLPRVHEQPSQDGISYLTVTKEILNLTRSMLKAAQAEDWEKVQEQEKRRQVLLNELSLNKGLTIPLEMDAAANLEVTVLLNARLIELGDHVKDNLKKEISMLQRGRKANLAYLYNGV